MIDTDKEPEGAVPLAVVLSSAQWQIVERAALLEGVSLTQFAETALIERARVVIDTHDKSWLSQRDMERFLQLLDEELEPTPALLRGIERYHESGLGK